MVVDAGSSFNTLTEGNVVGVTESSPWAFLAVDETASLLGVLGEGGVDGEEEEVDLFTLLDPFCFCCCSVAEETCFTSEVGGLKVGLSSHSPLAGVLRELSLSGGETSMRGVIGQ